MEMSNLDIRGMVVELKKVFVEGRILNVYGLNNRRFWFTVKTKDKKKLDIVLVLDKNEKYIFYDEPTQKPPKPCQAAMSLRKYLKESVVRDVSQHGLDRIIVFTLESKGQTVKLVAELFGKGNLLLLDKEHIILFSLKKLKTREGVTCKHSKYVYPPPKTLLKWRDPIKNEKLISYLLRCLNIGPKEAEEICFRSKLNPTERVNGLNKELDKLKMEAQKFAEKYSCSSYQGYLYLNEAIGTVFFSPIELSNLKNGLEKRFSSFNDAVKEYYRRMKEAEEEKEKIERKERTERILKELLKKKREYEEKACLLRAVGEKIFEKMHQIELEIKDFLEKGRTKELEVVSREKFPVVKVKLDGLTFDYNVRNKASENASQYLEKVKRLEGKVKRIEGHLERFKKEFLLEEKGKEKVKGADEKRKWFEDFIWFKSSDGLLVIGGRTQKQNKHIVSRKMDPWDLYFHVEGLPGSSVIIKKEKDATIGEKTVLEAAAAAAAYSSAWKRKISKVDVFYVKGEQVKKSGPTGQYLPKGAFYIEGGKHYVRNVEVSICIGLVKENGEDKVVGAPLSSLEGRALAYVVLFPGNMEKRFAAKKIQKFFSSFLETNISEIERLIPGDCYLGRFKRVEGRNK